MSGTWVEVFAGLRNPKMRQVLGAFLLEEPQRLGTDRATLKNLERWAKIGLLSQAEGSWQLNEQLLRDALAEQAKPRSEREGVERFFQGFKLQTLPAKPNERFAVLSYIRDAVINPSEQLTEPQLNERLSVMHPDVALLRRYMVDHGLLERTGDGSAYSRPTPK
ncbi:DUF2087 domain-containing protein [Glutamicibacter uratoxydans]|uniref:DUF2087 domain-containing protein n=1 Tax=Glutamicibacter uratoxydans TaxID=43667 RepID=UPI003D6FD092